MLGKYYNQRFNKKTRLLTRLLLPWKKKQQETVDSTQHSHIEQRKKSFRKKTFSFLLRREGGKRGFRAKWQRSRREGKKFVQTLFFFLFFASTREARKKLLDTLSQISNKKSSSFFSQTSSSSSSSSFVLNAFTICVKLLLL